MGEEAKVERKAPPLILLVDDLEDNIYVYSEILKRAGFEVVTAKSGEEALGILEEKGRGIDLVLSDVMMPGMSGFELCEAIKRSEALSDIPVVLITAQLVDDRHAAEGLEFGADDYISRPVQSALLVRKLEAILERKMAADRWREISERREEELKKKEWGTRMLVHDLRSPMTTALGYLSMMAMEPNLTERQRGMLAKVQQAVQMQMEMLEDMLTLTAAREGRLILCSEAFDLYECTLEQATLLQVTARQKGMEVKIEGSAPLMVRGDRRLIGRVVSNLLANAVKYGPGRTPIRIWLGKAEAGAPCGIAELKVEPGSPLFCIQNEGQPIPAEDQAVIFRPFAQRRIGGGLGAYRGVGLGLAFCDNIVREHGGTIGVLSPAPGREDGVLFYFTLPPSPESDEKRPL